MKTQQEIDEINQKRKVAIADIRKAAAVFKETGCSLGEHLINQLLLELKEMEEY